MYSFKLPPLFTFEHVWLISTLDYYRYLDFDRYISSRCMISTYIYVWWMYDLDVCSIIHLIIIHISLSDLRSSEIPVIFEVNSFSSTFLLFRVTKSPRECEKWILYKILHRFSGPIFFLAQNFSMKKIILKSGKIFSRKFSNFIKAKKYFHWKMKNSFFNENIFSPL